MMILGGRMREVPPYKSVDFEAGNSPASPNSRDKTDRARARKHTPESAWKTEGMRLSVQDHTIQGYLAYKKQPPPPRTTLGP